MSHEILECENMVSLAILSEGMAGYSSDLHKCVVIPPAFMPRGI